MSEIIKALRLNGTEYINPGSPEGLVTRNLAVESVTLEEPQRGEVVVEPIVCWDLRVRIIVPVPVNQISHG